LKRAPIDTSGGRPTSTAELNIARQLVMKSGVTSVLDPYVESEVGRPRQLNLKAMLVAMQVNALHRHHKAHLVETARVINALTEEQRQSLGLDDWDAAEAYPRVERLFLRICEVLDSREAGVDATWFANSFARAAIPKDVLESKSVAVDGTDVETWGALKGSSVTVELDGEAAETQLIEEPEERPVTRKTVTKAKVFGIGDDGRKIYTADPDARAGHRSAAGNRKAGPYVGYELHLVVQARDVKWTNYIDCTNLGPEVPAVITTCNLVAAGSHRAKAIVEELIESKTEVHDISDVVWDPGYSLCQPATTTYPLTEAGIAQTIELVTHQRGIRPFSGDALLLDGQLYSQFLPIELRDLKSPPRFRPAHYKRPYEDRFNQRSRWRLVRHTAADSDGFTRWKCPFCAGLLRSRKFPKTMRRSRSGPLVDVPEQSIQCCSGIISAPPVELPLTQGIPFGTTAWRISMNRRQIVESVNAALKGSYADLSRGFFRVFGRTKISVLLGFTIAAYNLDRVRAFRAKMAEDEAKPRKRARRRLGTWPVATSGETRTTEELHGPSG
jgi:hypothetical protein